jgi:hypothetical protein
VWGGGVEKLIKFTVAKTKEIAGQKAKQKHPKRTLLSIIRNMVKELEAEGRGQAAPYREAAPASPEAAIPEDDRYAGKSPAECAAIFQQTVRGLSGKFDSS